MNIVLLERTQNARELVYAAFRQCYSKEFIGKIWPKLISGEITPEQQTRLIQDTLKSGHVTPVEHVKFTFAIEGVSRSLTHQLVRHRIASYSHQSQRYIDSTQFEYITPPSINKIEEVKKEFDNLMKLINEKYKYIQEKLIEAGRTKSQANEDSRFVLPNACETKIVVTMNCSSLNHFFGLRCCQRAQWEIRNLANEMYNISKEEVPEIFSEKSGERCEKLGYCPENEKFSCGRYKTLQKILGN